jgi:hypothetical protein
MVESANFGGFSLIVTKPNPGGAAKVGAPPDNEGGNFITTVTLSSGAAEAGAVASAKMMADARTPKVRLKACPIRGLSPRRAPANESNRKSSKKLSTKHDEGLDPQKSPSTLAREGSCSSSGLQEIRSRSFLPRLCRLEAPLRCSRQTHLSPSRESGISVHFAVR